MPSTSVLLQDTQRKLNRFGSCLVRVAAWQLSSRSCPASRGGCRGYRGEANPTALKGRSFLFLDNVELGPDSTGCCTASEAFSIPAQIPGFLNPSIVKVQQE